MAYRGAKPNDMKRSTGTTDHHLSFTCGNLDQCMAQRDNYEAIFNSMNEGLFIVNSEGLISECNTSFLRLTGLRRQSVINKSVVDLFCENRSCGLNRAVQKTIRTGKPCREEKMDIIRKDGTKSPGIFSTSILRDKQGRETDIVVVFRDVSVEDDLQKRLHERFKFHQIIAQNNRMQEIFQLIENVAETDATVLIQGESGTGKELVAGALHYQSHRSDGPFIKVSCAALSESILESELFGHVKGAFTGAYRDNIGRFERAHKGTIFLDEIGEIGPAVQVKLLRVLQEREIERLGDTRTRKVDVRVIAATNKKLLELIDEKKFREDLYYRLKVITVDLPPLRERKEDIPLLVEHFIKKFNRRYGKQVIGISPDARDLLMECAWRGNVRELENAVEHAFVKTRGNKLTVSDLPNELLRNPLPGPGTGRTKPSLDPARLRDALVEAGGNQSKAARKLGVDRVTVWRNIKKYNITLPTE